MNSGIYTAYSGMQAQMDCLDIIANNLANINTTGFKEEKAFFTVLQESVGANQNDNPLQTAINNPVTVRGILNGTEGSMMNTYRDLDIAIKGDGFLVVETPGGIRYTRNGNLNLDSNGVLTTSNEFPVLGSDMKPIQLGPGKIQIGENGDVELDGAKVDVLKLVRFEKLSSLAQEGNSMFVSKSGSDLELKSDAKIKSGFLEQSNVNPISSVVRMVAILRDFESMQKSMNMITNEMNKKAIETLSR